MKKTAVVFDLDGTLIDSLASIAAACNHALVWSRRAALPESVVASFVGDGSRNLVARAMGASATEREIDAAVAEFLVYYEAHPIEGTTWMPDAREVLLALASHPIALVTNKARAVTLRVLDALDARSRFVAVIAGGDGPLKPDPAPIRAAMRAMGADAADTWVVGDGVQDVVAGRAAGCRTAAVRGGFTADHLLAAAGADVVIGSLLEILPLVQTARPLRGD